MANIGKAYGHVQRKDGKTHKSRRVAISPKVQQALDAYDRRKQAGEPLGHGPIMEETGLSSWPVERAIGMREAQEAAGRLPEIILSMSAQEKLDAHKRKLEKEFDWRVREKVIVEVDAAIARLKKSWADNLGKLEDAWKRRGKVFTKAEFARLLRVVHSDTGTHASAEELNTAFRLLNDRKIKLLDEEAFSTAVPRATMHRTLEEMADARARMKAQNRERALKAAATRKAMRDKKHA